MITRFKNKKLNSKKGFTLIDVLVGIALVLIIFLGVYGAFRLGMEVINKSKNKVTAVSIANQHIEMIRNLSYGEVGIEEGFPDGSLESSTTTTMNNLEYVIETRVDYVVDSLDGIADPEDSCPNDYKRVEVKVSWSGQFPGEISLVTDVSPKNLAEECGDAGGILSVSVFDAYGMMVSFPLIEVKDPDTDETIKSAAPSSGQHYFSLATSTYKIIVSKSNCSTERTYSTDEIATPEKPHPIVIEGKLVEMSFSIDETSTFSIDTLSSWGVDSFSDSFSDSTKISEYSDITVSNGEVKLATDTQGYLVVGNLISTSTNAENLIRWDELSWTDIESPTTDVKYQLSYASGTDWYLIPDVDFPGNSTGFDNSPIDLSGISTSTYSQIGVKGNLSTSDTSTSPILKDWQISWIIGEATPIPNASFSLQGNKEIGTNAAEEPVYKYSQNHVSDGGGHVNIASMEWDSYTFSIDPASGLDLVEISPSPQPISLLPDGVTQPVSMYLEAENSFLLTVKNLDTLEFVFAATTTLHNSGLGYNVSQYTDESGQTYFIPLEIETYDLDIEAPGYLPTSTVVIVSGDVTETVLLKRVE